MQKNQQHCRLLVDDCFCTFSGSMEVPRENQEEELKISRFNDVEEKSIEEQEQASPRMRVEDVWERKVCF